VVDAAARHLQAEEADRAITIARERFADLPAEIALRLLGRAVDRLGSEGQVELGKLERVMMALTSAAAGSRFRTTLAGAMITLSPRALRVERAPARRKTPKRR
jgi:tRNA(Ile)-lysidine synthase